MPTIIYTILGAIPQIINGIITAVTGSSPQVDEAGVTVFTALINNLTGIISKIVSAVPEIIAAIVSAFERHIHEMVNIGKNIVKGLWNGIQQLKSWLWNRVSGWISDIWDGICDFFGIHSPSREMAWVGEMLVKGLSGSIDENGGEAVSSAQQMADGITDVFDHLAVDMASALPTNFDITANANVVGTIANGTQASMANAPLVSIQQMIVRSDDDIRRVSQDLYDLIQTGSRAQGRYVIA